MNKLLLTACAIAAGASLGLALYPSPVSLQQAASAKSTKGKSCITVDYEHSPVVTLSGRLTMQHKVEGPDSRPSGGPYLKLDKPLSLDFGDDECVKLALVAIHDTKLKSGRHVTFTGTLGHFVSGLVDPPVFLDIKHLPDYSAIRTWGPSIEEFEAAGGDYHEWHQYAEVDCRGTIQALSDNPDAELLIKADGLLCDFRISGEVKEEVRTACPVGAECRIHGIILHTHHSDYLSIVLMATRLPNTEKSACESKGLEWRAIGSKAYCKYSNE
jgi:hypothetical protein